MSESSLNKAHNEIQLDKEREEKPAKQAEPPSKNENEESAAPKESA